MPARNRKQSEKRILLEALTRSESDAFIKEIEDRWHASRQRARLAIANTPSDHKREMLLVHLQEFGNWLFTRVRQSLIERVEVGRREQVSKVAKLSSWAEDNVISDLGLALIPEPPGSEKEELPGGIVQWSDYLPVVRDWLAVACGGWQIDVAQMVGWQTPNWAVGENNQGDATAMLVEDCATMLMEQVSYARTHAREYCTDIEASTVPAAVMKEISRKLAAKKRDLSEYLDTNHLSDLQRECLSLQLEHGLTVAEIAIHLKKDRATIYEHLARGGVNLQRAKEKEKGARRRAIVRRDDQS